TVESVGVPYVPFSERIHIQRVSRSSWQAVARWGFKQEPNVPQAIEQIAQEVPELELDPMRVSYFLSRQTVLVVRRRTRLGYWQR
ncbi:hypothetical protein SMA90_34245, partial [Escherichia coli]